MLLMAACCSGDILVPQPTTDARAVMQAKPKLMVRARRDD
jgi:hypothetical protein